MNTKTPEKQPVRRPFAPHVFKERFIRAVEFIEKNIQLQQVGERERRVVAAALNRVFGGEKTMRYEVCAWLTGHASTKSMSRAQIKALLRVLDIEDFDDVPIGEAIVEFRQAHAEALKEKGQQVLPMFSDSNSNSNSEGQQ